MRPGILIASLVAAPCAARAASGPVPTVPPRDGAVVAAPTIDPRLSRPITLGVTGIDLGDLVERMSRACGAPMTVRADLRDLKVTVWVRQLPERDLMRQLVRLFDLRWTRSGAGAGARYLLGQTLEQRIAEEERRREDDNQMLLDVVNETQPLVAEARKSKAELARDAAAARRAVNAQGGRSATGAAAEDLLQRMAAATGAQPEMRLFALLTPDQLLTLRDGKEVGFRFGGDPPIPASIARQWLAERGPAIQLGGRPASVIPARSLEMHAGFALARAAPDRLVLESRWTLRLERPGGGDVDSVTVVDRLATGQPDRIRAPGNRREHASLGATPPFSVRFIVAPRPGFRPAPGASDGHSGWIDSGDFFAAVHRSTGLSLIADDYLRLYRPDPFRFRGRRLLEILNDAGDALRSGWTNDDGILRFRRFNYYVERTLDLPGRTVRAWAAERRSRGWLDPSALAGMAVVPRAARERDGLEAAIDRRFGLAREWRLSARAGSGLRILALLNADQKRSAQQPEGLPLSHATLEQVEAAWRIVWGSDEQPGGPDSAAPEVPIFPPAALALGRFALHFRPPGVFEWIDDGPAPPAAGGRLPVAIVDRDRRRAESAVRAYLNASGRSRGDPRAELGRIEGPEMGIVSLFSIGRWRFRQDATPSVDRMTRSPAVVASDDRGP